MTRTHKWTLVALALALIVGTSSMFAAPAAIAGVTISVPVSSYPEPVLDDQPGAQNDRFTFPASAEYDFSTPQFGFVTEGQAYTTYGAASVPYDVYSEGLSVHSGEMSFDTTGTPPPPPPTEPPIGPNTAFVKADGHSSPYDSDTRAYVVFQNNSGATIYGIDARAVNSRDDTIFPDGYYTEPILHGKSVQINWFANALPDGKWTFSVQPNYDPKQNMEVGVLDTRRKTTTQPPTSGVRSPKVKVVERSTVVKAKVINRKVTTPTRGRIVFKWAGKKVKKQFTVAPGGRKVIPRRCLRSRTVVKVVAWRSDGTKLRQREVIPRMRC